MSKFALPILRDREPDVAGLECALKGAVAGDVRFDRLSRALYSTDASVYQIIPLGVVLPRSQADVAATVRICSRFQMPITARGGGTSQAGQAIGPGLILDFSRHFHRVLEINPTERWARVEPGCVLDDLNRRLAPLGLRFAPDISTSNRATIGGMIANNASGTHSLVHGKTIDHVLGLRVVLADGSTIETQPLSPEDIRHKCSRQDLEGACYREIARLALAHAAEIDRRYPKLLRRVGGYNLDRFLPSTRMSNLSDLFVGSEGTLGIVVEARLRLIETPRATALAVIHFSELLDALAATPAILEHRPAAVEVIDKYVLDSTKLNSEAARLRDFLQGDPGAILIVEFFGDRPEDLPDRINALEADLRRRGRCYHVHRACEQGEQNRIWKLRKAALGLSMAEKGDAKALSFVEDSAVRPDLLRDYIGEFLEIIARHGTRAGVYAHASVGCLHVRPVINLKTEEGVKRFEAIALAVSDLVLKYGGALSGEHGDGLVRSPFQEKMFGPVLYQAFRELKQTFDPQGIFNPGKIIDAPPLRTNLRYGPSYVTPDVPTTFDFSADGGVVRASELCAGVGECRKRSEGSMCPSFQATAEEVHSTRGRANVLRLALTGQLGFKGFTDPVLRQALDLCLECKACKAECPTNVDMARLKAEFLHQFYRRRRMPLRQQLFGRVAGLAWWSAQFPRLANRLARQSLIRRLADSFLGIDRRRLVPALARRSFFEQFSEQWIRQTRAVKAPVSGGPEVLLFVDTFARFFEPDIALAAWAMLSELGCRVIPGRPDGSRVREDLAVVEAVFDAPVRAHLRTKTQPDGLVCCGRPMISNGLLEQAVSNAQVNVRQLHPWAAAGKPIIACEPSCILTIKDDYPALLRGEMRAMAEVVARQCFTFEDYLSQRLEEGTSFARPAFAAGQRRILVQAHCHQRALVGISSTLRLLQRLPDVEIVDLDAGCCGMGGSFGYEKEHYEISRLVGEQRLFPAIRRAGSDTTVVAAGFSCRQQIQHFTGRRAYHPASLLHPLLKTDAIGTL